MADDVGSVADETARLLDALLGSVPTDAKATNGSKASAEGRPDDVCSTCGHQAGVTQTETPGSSSAPSTDVCHLCPVCQLLRVVRSVRPETLERLADLAGAVTETLRDAAASRWREAEGAPRRPSRPDVEDIPVAGDEGAGEAGPR